MLFRFFVFSSNGMCHYCQLSWPRFSYIFSPRVAFPWLYVNGHTLQRFEFPAPECHVNCCEPVSFDSGNGLIDQVAGETQGRELLSNVHVGILFILLYELNVM